MGQKIHPLGFRLCTTQNHDSIWFAQPRNYSPKDKLCYRLSVLVVLSAVIFCYVFILLIPHLFCIILGSKMFICSLRTFVISIFPSSYCTKSIYVQYLFVVVGTNELSPMLHCF